MTFCKRCHGEGWIRLATGRGPHGDSLPCPTCHGAPEWVEELVAGVEVKPEEAELELEEAELELEEGKLKLEEVKLKEAELELEAKLKEAELELELKEGEAELELELEEIEKAAQEALDAECAAFGEASNEAWARYHAEMGRAASLKKGRAL